MMSSYQPPKPPPKPTLQKPASPTAAKGKLTVTTLDAVPGYHALEHYGLVTGSVVRSKSISTDFAAGLKNIVGGEIKSYTQLMEEARKEATERMVLQAQVRGANAVVAVRFATSSIADGAAELYAYGTALLLEANAPNASGTED